MTAFGELSVETVVQGNQLFTEFKGALTEQFVLQEMIAELTLKPYYYSAENSRMELDFLVQDRGELIPVEVKAEENLKSKSLRIFTEKYEIRSAVRISMSDYREQDWMVNLPLYGFSAFWENRWKG